MTTKAEIFHLDEPFAGRDPDTGCRTSAFLRHLRNGRLFSVSYASPNLSFPFSGLLPELQNNAQLPRSARYDPKDRRAA